MQLIIKILKTRAYISKISTFNKYQYKFKNKLFMLTPKMAVNKIPQRTKVQQCTKVQFVSLQSGEFNTVEVRYLFLKTGNSHLCAMLQSKNEMDLI